ncbi:MAG: sensor histidine kinase response regulator [Lacunisphaera sp.]|nr:sensor histidine kinase response regulator [Lacunisphaera sp.]
MNAWLAQNPDYLAFLALVAASWIGLGWWLRRTDRFRALPRLTWLLLAIVLGGGWLAVNRAGRDAQKNLRQQVELLLPFYVREFQQMGHAQLSDNPTPDDPVYLRLIRAQLHWLKNNPAIANIYTVRRRADGAVFLLVDSETDYDHNGRYEGAREQRTKPGAVYPGVAPALERALGGEQVFEDDITTDRWGRWVSAFAPLRDGNGKVEGVLGVDFDANEWLAQRAQGRQAWLWLLGGMVLLITGSAVVIALLRHELAGRAQTESALREQSELRRQIFDRAPGGVALVDLDYHFLKVNEAFCQMFGYTREELLRLTFVQITHPDDVARTIASNQQVASGGVDRVQFEKRYIRKDGSILEAAVSIGLIRDAGGAPKYLVGQISDISERRHAEAELLVRQKQLGTILASTPVILFAIDAQGRYTMCDGAALAALGRKPGDVVGQSAFDLYAARPDLLADFRRGLAGETFMSQREMNDAVFELRCTPLREPDGRISGLIGIALDITARVSAAREREKMERKLLEVQKLESLGVLAGGVAHDFNNLLTSILGNAGLIRLALGEASPVRSNVHQIEQASQTAATLCQQLLSYAGRGRLDTSELDLSRLVRETTDLLRLSVGNHAQLTFHLADGLPGIVADAAQIRQVLLNIVLNAAEAIGRRDGIIEVTTRLQPLDAAWLADARTGQDLAPGEYAVLDIRDNGSGLDAVTQARVFDPFFSTKGSGRGLGLAAALGIMRSHQGALRLNSQPGQGTHFTLAFPIQSKPAAEHATGANGVRHWRGSGSVLIVDDEEAVRATAAQMIAYFGFDVRQADSGQQALDLMRANPTAFDLVLLDLTMPGMDGYATFTALRQLRPEQRIVIFSGYSAHDARQRFAGQNLNGFLQKPFSANSLREVLGQIAPK